jgi:hypothetical protein
MVKPGTPFVAGIPRPYLLTVLESRLELLSTDQIPPTGEMIIELENSRRFALVNLFF